MCVVVFVAAVAAVVVIVLRRPSYEIAEVVWQSGPASENSTPHTLTVGIRIKATLLLKLLSSVALAHSLNYSMTEGPIGC